MPDTTKTAKWLRYKRNDTRKSFGYECGNCANDALVRPTPYCPHCGFPMQDKTGKLAVYDKDTGERVPDDVIPTAQSKPVQVGDVLYYVGSHYGKPIVCQEVVSDVFREKTTIRTYNAIFDEDEIDTGTGAKRFRDRTLAEVETKRQSAIMDSVGIGDTLFRLVSTSTNRKGPLFNAIATCEVTKYNPEESGIITVTIRDCPADTSLIGSTFSHEITELVNKRNLLYRTREEAETKLKNEREMWFERQMGVKE